MVEDTRFTWSRAFNKALEHDLWGQVEEALDGYQQLQVAAALEAVDNVLQLPDKRRQGIASLATVLKLRMRELSSTDKPGLGTAGMQALQPFMSGLLVSDVALPPDIALIVQRQGSATAADAADGSDEAAPARQGPAALRSVGSKHLIKAAPQGGDGSGQSAVRRSASITRLSPSIPAHPGTSAAAAGAAGPASGTAGGTLRPPPAPGQGETMLSLDIVSWAVKGGCQMVAPHILVVVRDARGKLLEAQQETPVASSSRAGGAAEGAGDLLDWNVTCHLQTALNRLPRDAAIFLELRHYKVAKKKVSTKGWSCVELGEVRAEGGPLVCEVYKKPVGHKGRPVLLTSKPLYLQLHATLRHG